MKKTHRHDELSNKIRGATGCQRRIKKRLEDRYEICYHFYCKQKVSRRHLMQDARPKTENR